MSKTTNKFAPEVRTGGADGPGSRNQSSVTLGGHDGMVRELAPMTIMLAEPP